MSTSSVTRAEPCRIAAIPDENELNVPVNERRNDLSEINGDRFFARPSVLSRHAGVPPSFGQRANAFERAVQKSALGFPATTSDQHRASKLERRLHLSHSRMFSLSTMSNHLSHAVSFSAVNLSVCPSMWLASSRLNS